MNGNENLNYYDVLEVDKLASHDNIRKSYKKLALKYHPDKNSSPESTEKFQQISEAFSVIGNEETRNQYDKNILMTKFNFFDLRSSMNLFRNINPEFYEKWLYDIEIDDIQEKIDTFVKSHETETKIMAKLFTNFKFKPKKTKSPSSTPTEECPETTSETSQTTSETSQTQSNTVDNINITIIVSDEEVKNNIIKKIELKCFIYDKCSEHLSKCSTNCENVNTRSETKILLVPTKYESFTYDNYGDSCLECGQKGNVNIFCQCSLKNTPE